MPYLIVLVLAAVVVVLVMRAASASGRGLPPTRAPRSARRPVRPRAPDDDPEFLRELERRARRDDGRPT